MTSNLIPLNEGAEMTAMFKTEKNTILNPKLADQGILPTCETFERSSFDLFLANNSCVGIRVYSGMDADMNVRFVICGVDANDEDIYLPDPSAPSDFLVIEKGARCPLVCPPTSALNR